MPLELIKLTTTQVKSLSKDKTVFFFPVGPIEDHGPHLPIGLDLLEAERLCFISAQHLEEEMNGWRGVIMPTAPLGVDSNTTELKLTVRAHVIRDWLVDSTRGLVQMGFIHFVCFTGHLGPKQLTAIEDAGKLIRRYGRWTRWSSIAWMTDRKLPTLISASSALVSWRDTLESPFWPDPKEHGGERDTSIGLLLIPDHVDPQFRGLPRLERLSSRWGRNWKRRQRKLQFYWGNPSQASSESGEQELVSSLEKVFPKMRAVWEGASPQSLFRSWYSILPPNKSFFKAWSLAFFVIVILASLYFLEALQLEFNS